MHAIERDDVIVNRGGSPIEETQMNVSLAANLGDAEAYITSVAFPAASSSAAAAAAAAPADSGIWALTASEDDACRLYNLDEPQQLPQRNASSPSLTSSFLRATYRLPAMGVHKCVFAQGNAHALIAPRARADHQIYALALETGQLLASYSAAPAPQPRDPTPEAALSWFTSLVVHPTARGVFAACGENSSACFFNAGVAAPVARLATASVGRPVVEFSPDGSRVAVGDKDSVLVYDWRNMSAGPLATFRVRDVVHAARWLSDVGSVSGLHFHPARRDHLLLTTSRFVVRTLDIASGAAVCSFGASGVAASHLPNERPAALAGKRAMPTAARFSPDGSMVAVGTCMARVAVFDATATAAAADGNGASSDAAAGAGAAQPNLSHVLYGSHTAAVSVTEWCPSVPVLMSACRVASVWRFGMA